MNQANAAMTISVEVVLFAVINESLSVWMDDRDAALGFQLPSLRIDSFDDRNLEHAVRRCVRQAVGGEANYIEQVKTVGNATRYPGQWAVGVVYYALLTDVPPLSSGRFIAVDALYESESVAFDHLGLVMSSLKRLRNKAQYTTLPLYFMAERFTLAELQRVYEHVLQASVEKKAFRRRMLDSGVLVSTGTAKKTSSRPAVLYRVHPNHIVHHFSRNMHGVH